MGKHYLGIDTAFDMLYYSLTHHLRVFVQPTTHVALISGEKTIRIWKVLFINGPISKLGMVGGLIL